MLRSCDTDKPCLHLVYDMWDSMIEKVKVAIYRHEEKQHDERSTFYDVVHGILVSRWEKNNTRLHCLAHSLNPRYYIIASNSLVKTLLELLRIKIMKLRRRELNARRSISPMLKIERV